MTRRVMPPRQPRKPATPQQAIDTPLRAGARLLCAAEITAICAGRRLYRTGAIGANATVNTILCYTDVLQAPEQLALDQIGDRSFGICARAGMLYQQASDLLSELAEL
jgi:hypothetical protein